MAEIDTRLFQEFLTSRERVDNLEQELERAKAERDDVEERLKKAMIAAGVRQQKNTDGVSFSLSTEFKAGNGAGCTTKEFCAALKAAGLKDFVYETYAWAALSSWAKEIYEEKTGRSSKDKPHEEMEPDKFVELLPEALRGKVSVYKRARVRVSGEKRAREAREVNAVLERVGAREVGSTNNEEGTETHGT